MAKRFIIKESQLIRLKKAISENSAHQLLVNKLLTDLNANYEPILGTKRVNGEYKDEPMVKIKVDNDTITPKELFDYFKKKYKFGDEFIKQTIKDWMFGKIKDDTLSKNVPIN